MRHPIITLLTDFGLKDHYVASMKGVILGINPRCTVVDISHQVAPQDVEEGAFVLAAAFTSFPPGTIHLGVVDPGVGGPRRPLLVVTEDYYFVGPDNGLFSLALRRENIKRLIVPTNKSYFLPRTSSTFHGRDVFVPVAAHLSLGVRPESFGSRTGACVELRFNRPGRKGEELTGEIIHVDAFGNLVSNIDEENLFDFVRDRLFSVRVDRYRVRGLKGGYWEGRKGEVLALIGSGGFLEIAVREGNARKRLKAGRGDRVRIRIEKGR